MVQLFWGPFFWLCFYPFSNLKFGPFLIISFSCLVHFLFISYSILIYFLFISYSCLIHFLLKSYVFPIQFLLISFSCLIHFLFISYLSFSFSFISFHFLWSEKFTKIPKSMDMFLLSISYLKTIHFKPQNQLGKGGTLQIPEKVINKGKVNKVLGLDG